MRIVVGGYEAGAGNTRSQHSRQILCNVTGPVQHHERRHSHFREEVQHIDFLRREGEGKERLRRDRTAKQLCRFLSQRGVCKTNRDRGAGQGEEFPLLFCHRKDSGRGLHGRKPLIIGGPQGEGVHENQMRHALRAMDRVGDRDRSALAVPAEHEAVNSGVVNDSLEVLQPGRQRKVTHVPVRRAHAAAVIPHDSPTRGDETIDLPARRFVVEVPVDVAPHVGRVHQRLPLAHHAVGDAHPIAGLRVLDARFHDGRILHPEIPYRPNHRRPTIKP